MVHHRHSHHSGLHMAKIHIPAVHLPKSHYKFSTFVKDVSTPFRGAVKEITGTFNHGLNVASSFGKIGSSLATPLIIIGVAGIAFIVVNKGSIR